MNDRRSYGEVNAKEMHFELDKFSSDSFEDMMSAAPTPSHTFPVHYPQVLQG